MSPVDKHNRGGLRGEGFTTTFVSSVDHFGHASPGRSVLGLIAPISKGVTYDAVRDAHLRCERLSVCSLSPTLAHPWKATRLRQNSIKPRAWLVCQETR